MVESSLGNWFLRSEVGSGGLLEPLGPRPVALLPVPGLVAEAEAEAAGARDDTLTLSRSSLSTRNVSRRRLYSLGFTLVMIWRYSPGVKLVGNELMASMYEYTLTRRSEEP